MVTRVRRHTAKTGPSTIRENGAGIAGEAERAPQAAESGEPVYRVKFILPGGRSANILVPKSCYILDAALEAGVELPSLCQQGWCCTCSVRLLEGEVDQSDSRRFYRADRRAGFALICTGKPRSDLKVKSHALEDMRAHRIASGLPVPRGTTLPRVDTK